MSSVWSLVIKSIPDRGEKWGHDDMICASCRSCYFGDGNALYLVGYWITASVPAHIHQGAQCPVCIWWPLCLPSFPLCVVFSSEPSNTSNSYLRPQSVLAANSQRQTGHSSHFGSAYHSSCSALNCFPAYICNFYVTTCTVSSEVEKLWNHKTFAFLLTTKPFFLKATSLNSFRSCLSVCILLTWFISEWKVFRKAGFTYLMDSNLIFYSFVSDLNNTVFLAPQDLMYISHWTWITLLSSLILLDCVLFCCCCC